MEFLYNPNTGEQFMSIVEALSALCKGRSCTKCPLDPLIDASECQFCNEYLETYTEKGLAAMGLVRMTEEDIEDVSQYI